MSRTRFFLIPLTTLIIMGVLVLGGFAIHRIGWTGGYQAGLLVDRGQEGAVAPYAPYNAGLSGLLLAILIILILLGVVGKFFRFWAWKAAWGPWMRAGGPGEEDWARHWHRAHRSMRHRPVPPWCWGWEEPAEEQTGNAEAESETGNAGAPA